ncbi:MAG: 3-isopropylmalate dehydratase small subunit [Allosphingosinicella sp.]
MTPLFTVHGRAYRLDRDNVDTDAIVAAEHLKTISRSGLGRFAFAALRAEPGNAFDEPQLAGAPILVAGSNFGCGSSREHAVWALVDLGIRAVVAPSFSDIFAANAYKNGLLTVALDRARIGLLMALDPAEPMTIDVETMRLSSPAGCFRFALDPFRRACLLQGVDEIALTLASEPGIRAYELRTGV